MAIVGVRFFGLSRPLTRYLERLASHDLALRVLGRVRVRVYRQIEPLAPAQLEGYRQGDLLARMVADVDALQNLHLRAVGPPLVGAAGGRRRGRASPRPSSRPPGSCSPPACSSAGSPSRRSRAGSAAAADGARPRPAASCRPSSSRSCARRRSSSPTAARRAAQARLRAADGALVRLSRRDALVGGLADGAGLAVVGATVAGVLAVAVHASADGHLDRTLIAMLALLALASFEAVQPLAAAARELSVTLAAGGRVLELADREAAVVDPVAPLPAPSWPFAVALEDVRARYAPGERAALDGVSLRLEPGCRVALVGPSGAGKTTVVNLLLRFLDPEAGRVTLAGRDLREYRQEDVRRAIAVAGQDSHLFSASIRENVCLARPGASDEDVEEALRRARLWPWVAALPDGLDTAVGEEGRELSGGQRQRLVLARALLADAPVLVLDEPTAHLDPATARALVEDVFAAAGDRSVLLITHRPEGLELVDGDHPHRMMPAGLGGASMDVATPTQRKGAAMAIGPVQLIVLGFSHPEFHGEIVAELERLKESDTVRVIDALAVHKDADGEIEVAHLSNLSKDEAIELGSKVGALIGLGIEGEEGMDVGAEAGAEAGADGISVFDDEDAWDILEEIPNDSAAALILLEHHWAVPLRDAIARAGGFRLSDGFISPLDLVAIGLVSSEEAQQLHAAETSRQPA